MHTLNSRVPDASTAITLLQLQQQQSRDVDMMSQSPSSDFQQQQQQRSVIMQSPGGYQAEYPQQAQAASPASLVSRNPVPEVPNSMPFSPEFGVVNQSYESQTVSAMNTKRGDFELRIEENLDVVAKGLISLEDAELYFETFFQGCVSHRLSPSQISIRLMIAAG